MAEGFVLSITPTMLKRLDEADGKISKLQTTSDKTSSKIIDDFRRMAAGVDPFMEKIKNVNNLLSKLSAPNISIKGFKETATDGEKAAKATASITESLNKIKSNPIDDINKKIASLKELLNQATRSVEEYSRKMASVKSTGSGMISGTTIKEGGAGAALIPQIQAEIAALEQEKKSISSSQVLWQQRLDALNNSSLATQRQVSDLAKLNESFRTGQSEMQKQAKVVDSTADAISKMIVALDKAATSQNKINDAEKNKNQKKSDTAAERALEKYNNALNKSEVTIANRARKIEALANAERALTKTGRDYTLELTKIRTETERLNKANVDAANSVSKVKSNQRSLIDTSGQLERKLALLFSISQIEGYVMKMVNIRGEFELQNVALRAILQNKDEADRLFGQITELAVRSPFRVKELVTYTKELAAYRVESSKLYDTTKMLADVSAGLGVDMSRLILAFGQVKAANYLRGTELRQFSEAGINILGELATYYSELEGRMVKVAEVQERVTKRMVAFGDVEEIFNRITSAGGIFYNMQEIQAETLAGQMSNLGDSIDIMFNKIGMANEGLLKGVVGTLKYIIDNYEKLIPLLKAVAAGFLLFKINSLAARDSVKLMAIQLGVLNTTIPKTLSMSQLLNIGFKKLSFSIKSAGASMKAFALSNVYLLAFAAIATAVYEAWTWNDKYNEKIDDINRKSAEQKKALLDVSLAYDNISKKAKGAADATLAYSEVDILKDKKKQLSELSELLRNEGLELPVSLEFVTKDSVDEVFKQGKEMLEFAQGFGQEFSKAIAEGETEAEIGGLLGENLKSDLKDLSDAYSNITGSTKAQLDEITNEIASVYDKLNAKAKAYYDEIKDGRKENETELEFYFRRLDLTKKINDTLKQHVGGGYYKSIISGEEKLNRLVYDRWQISKKEIEAQKELDKVISTIRNKYPEGYFDNLSKEQKITILAQIDKEFEQKELDEQTKRLASHYASQKFGIQVEAKEVTATKSFYTGWKGIVASLDTNKLFTSQLANINTIEEFEKVLQSTYKAELANAEVLERANTKRLNLTNQLKQAEQELAAARINQNREEIANSEAKINSIRTAREETEKDIELSKKTSKSNIASISNIASSMNLLLSVSSKTNNIEKDRISLIKEMNSQYEKLIQNLNKEAAANQVRASYKDTFAELFKGTEMEGTIATMDFDVSGAISALEQLLKTASGKARLEAQKALDGLRARVNLDVLVERTDEVKSELEDLFSGYELSLELEKLNIPPELAKQLFNVDVFNLDELQKKAAPYLAELRAQGGNQIKVADDIEKKISDMNEKALIDRMKTYSKYLRNNMTERVSIEMEAMEKINEINKIEEFTPEMKETAKQAVKKETQQKLDKQEWADFKDTDLYIKMFEDLESTSTKTLELMREKLISLRANLKELSPQELKEINKQIDDIGSQIVSNNPFKGLTDNIKDFISYQKERKQLEEDYRNAITKQSFIKGQSEEQDRVVRSLESQYNALLANSSASEEERKKAKQKLDIARAMLNTLLQQLVAQGKITQEYADQVAKGEKMQKDLSERFKETGSYFSEFSSGILNVGSSLENIFGTMSAGTKDTIDSISEIAAGLGDTASGVGRIMSGDIIGGGIQAVSGLFATVGSIFAIGDKKKERQIQRELQLIDKLQKSYEKLEKAIDNAYSLDTLQSANKAAKANLQEQIAATERAIAAEDAKKKTDHARIEEMREQIESYKEQLKELEEQRLESLGGFGSETNYKSAAEEFANAWYDAYKETGDGLTGLEDTFDSFIDNIVKKQLLLRGTQQLLDPLLKMIDGVVSDGIVDLGEMEKIEGQWQDQTKPALDALYKMLADQMGIMGGQADAELSGLQRGITQITESQASEISALLSSTRFFVADSNTVIKNIYALFSNPDAPNPILSELKAQTMLVRSIYDLFNGMTAPHPTFGKRALLTVI